MCGFLLKEDGGALLKEDGFHILLDLIGTKDLMNRKSPTGQTVFISQYIRNRLNKTEPWKRPNGITF